MMGVSEGLGMGLPRRLDRVFEEFLTQLGRG